MSGGVGPTYNDITLPHDEHQHDVSQILKDTTAGVTSAKEPHHKSGFFSLRQLNSLAIIIVFAASGLVSLEDFAFFAFCFVYMIGLSKIAFPPLPHQKNDGRIADPNSKILRLYIIIAGIVGLFLPICYIFEGLFEGDKEGIQSAAPHVFLLACQVFMEGVVFSDKFSTPIKVLVPVFYNARRVLTLVEWLQTEFMKPEEQFTDLTARRIYVGRVLAAANTLLWSFNLFGFLLPVCLPRAFKKYYVIEKKEK